jgi:hypothetical protein
MSDNPLFQNMDEQEAIYAPDQRAPDDPTHRTPTDELGTTDAGGGATSNRETGTGGSPSGSSNRELNDSSGQTPSG